MSDYVVQRGFEIEDGVVMVLVLRFQEHELFAGLAVRVFELSERRSIWVRFPKIVIGVVGIVED